MSGKAGDGLEPAGQVDVFGHKLDLYRVPEMTPEEEALARGDGGRERSSLEYRHDDLDLVRTANGVPIFNLATAVEILCRHSAWEGVLAFDEFRDAYVLTQQIPGAPRDPHFRSGRELTDRDVAEAVIWFNRNHFPGASRSVVDDAMRTAAARRVVNEVRHFLEDLRWDGQARLASLLSIYAGADVDTYTSEAGLRWMIQAVARVMEPGCKAEGCLVLEGRQGSGKSTLLRLLAGAAFFGDALPDMSGKDASLYLRGKWIVELSEMQAANKTDFETMKSFLSRQEERYRPPYGRSEVVEPRRCVFAGTTNRSDYLRDPSGNRRFWPVRTGEIDLEGIARDRAQLWAEAVARYRNGERWWLSGEVEAAAVAAQAERNEDDPWRGDVLRFVDGKDSVAIRTILADAIGVEKDRMGRAETLRVAGLLAEIGFVRDGQFTSGDEKGLARFVRRSAGR